MGKKSLLFLCAFLSVSVALLCWSATTWQLQTKLSNTGGTLQVRDKVPQTTAGIVAYHNFTTSAPVPVTVAANTGYQIASLFRNGVAIPVGNYTSHYLTTFQKSGATQSLVAGFAARQVTVTASVSGPGSITPSSIKVNYGGSAVFTGVPSTAGCYLTSASGGSVTDLNGAPVTLPYSGTVRITAGNVTTPRTVTACYASYSVDAGIDQRAQINGTVRLSGSMVGGGVPSWSQISGPAVSLVGAGTLTPSFVAASTGTYQFRLTQSVSGVAVASATTQVVVVASLVEDMRLGCMGCHAATGVVPAPYVFTGWSSSKHVAAGVSCITCHTDGAMPTPVNSSSVDANTFAYRSGAGSFCLNGSCHQPGITHRTVGMTCSGCHGSYRSHNPATTFGASLNACFTCHGAANSTHYQVRSSLSAADCLICHRPAGHDPAPDAKVTAAHFNGYTSYANPSYALAYVTPLTVCADCHRDGAPKGSADGALLEFRRDWAASGHGIGPAWKNSPYFNWKTAGTAGAKAAQSASVTTDCQRCHSTAGFLKFALYTSIDPVQAGAERYSEPLTCNACHPSGDFAAPRAISPRTGYYNYSGPATGRVQVSASYPDAGRSNICLGCHVGRQAGATVQALSRATAQKSYSSAFWRDLRFVDAHYLSAGGQLYGATGYHYPGLSYDNAGVNHTAIGDTGAGPCVACHLPSSSHTLSVAAGGFTLCNGCHIDGGLVSAGFLQQRRDQFAGSLKALAAALTAKGLPPLTDAGGKPAYPYFAATNWGGRDDGPGNLGAAFNYNLLVHDPGAFAHNPAYVKRLVRDSIDFLTFGSIDRGRDLTPTIEALLPGSADRDNATAFLSLAGSGASACQVCHRGATDPLTGGNIVADYGASKHALSAGGAACVSCHAPSATTIHPNAAPMLKATSDINPKCLNCHPLHPWPSEGICTDCHNGHRLKAVLPAPHLANFSTAQYVTTQVECDRCHYTAAGSNVAKFVLLQEHRDWAQSAKGDYRSPALTSFDFKTMGTPAPVTPATTVQQDCVRCHTTSGFNRYVQSNFADISPFGIPGAAPGGDRTREMIGCAACHATPPFTANYDRWKVGIVDEVTGTRDVRSWYNYSSAATGKIIRSKLFLDSNAYDLGDSNICITCHAGRLAGDVIKQTTTSTTTGAIICSTLPSIVCRLGNNTLADGLVHDFWGSVDFIDPHGGVAANMIYPDNLRPGYEYRAAASTTAHANVGMEAGRGPCVGCHMSSPAGRHAFTALSTATNGVIGAIRSAACSGCHGPTAVALTPSDLQGKKEGYQASLSLIAAQLAAQGIHYNRGKSPYFFDTADEAQQSQATRVTNWNRSAAFRGAQLMGAAFNLRLLDSGSGWVHNGVYAKRLLYDTIDYLDDGLTNHTVAATVQDQTILSYLYPRR
ncbi:cytochrome c3 family protein [Geomonas oryzisoli]|uniref:Cytochrome c3 family protein n=1 Tax=Geomonas oryzisoli TaxID=2847992 RepID=A0ABX8J279_9BACT|nr:cytochrome c3 family protein [Geomonas oryzisoli]QWV92449.1 cytochrome c3 family protein [Geomonas oryzisoli]